MLVELIFQQGGNFRFLLDDSFSIRIGVGFDFDSIELALNVLVFPDQLDEGLLSFLSLTLVELN